MLFLLLLLPYGEDGEDMRTCPQCQESYADGMNYCPRDATPLPPPLSELPQAANDATQVTLASGLSNRYRILRGLGQGGMGRVFLAEQVAVGNRLVALKVLHHKLLEDPDFLQRFQDEASSTGRIRHQNVVTVYECGQADDGSPYIAMEYLEGESLRQTLKRRGSLPLLEAVEILQQAARGLNAAHKLGIVHRDLKPDNIFLTQDDDGQVLVKIVDFGIAKMRESTSHTMTGLSVGTPAYMSVEQASGMRSDELDARSDVYSLGIVAYEMITGRVPFQANTPLAYLKKHLVEPPVSISVSRPDLHIAPQVDEAIMKALQKERTDRYPTAPDFARALATTVLIPPSALTTSVQPTPLPVSPTPVTVPTVTLARRKAPGWAWAAGGVIVATIGGMTWFAMNGGTPTKPRPPMVGVAPRSNAATLHLDHPVTAIPGTHSTRPVAQPEELEANGSNQDVSRKVKSDIAQGDNFFSQGKYDYAIAQYRKALTMAPGTAGLTAKIRQTTSAKEAEQRIGGSGQQQTKPLTKAQVADLLKSYDPPGRVAGFAQHRGIDFEWTPTIEAQMRQAGANDGLIQTLREIAPEPAASDTETYGEAAIDRAQDLLKAERFSEALPVIERAAKGEVRMPNACWETSTQEAWE